MLRGTGSYITLISVKQSTFSQLIYRSRAMHAPLYRLPTLLYS